MDEYLHFPSRVYNTFEMPTKLMRMRAPLPSLLRRPDVYQHMRVTDGCQAALLCIGGLLRSQSLRHAFKNFCFMEAQALLDLEKKFGGAITVIDREGVPLGGDDEMSDEDEHELTAGAPAPRPPAVRSRRSGSTHRGRRRPTRTTSVPRRRQGAGGAPPDRLPEAKHRRPAEAKGASAAATSSRASRCQWYLATIPKVGENEQCTRTRAAPQPHRRAEGEDAGGGRQAPQVGVLPTYYPSLLYCDEIGGASCRRRPLHPRRLGQQAAGRAQQGRHEVAVPHLQPSAARVEQLGVAYGEEEEEVARQFGKEAATEELYGLSGCSRWDPLPSKLYLDADPQKLFQSVFQQTEEQILAETKAMYEGAVETWKSKLVVDDPVFHLTMRSSDKVAQADRYKGILHDPAMKKSLKGLYRKKPLVGGDNTGSTARRTGGSLRPSSPTNRRRR